MDELSIGVKDNSSNRIAFLNKLGIQSMISFNNIVFKIEVLKVKLTQMLFLKICKMKMEIIIKMELNRFCQKEVAR